VEEESLRSKGKGRKATRERCRNRKESRQMERKNKEMKNKSNEARNLAGRREGGTRAKIKDCNKEK